MSDSVRPHGRQPARLPHPWDSPVKKTGVGCHFLLQIMKVKSESEVAQSCLTLCNPMYCSPPGSSIHGILQARVLEWGATAFPVSYQESPQIGLVQFSSVQSLSHVRLFVTPWTAAHQAPPSMGFSRPEYWSGGAIAFSIEVHMSFQISIFCFLWINTQKWNCWIIW